MPPPVPPSSSERADSQIRALIVDDEPLAREGMRIQLERHPDVEIVGECSNGEQAIGSIEELRPDLVFLDVQMPALDGFDVLDAVGADRMPHVVFVTAHDTHAVRAFEAHALDYVLKPIDPDRFEQALDRARDRLREDRFGKMGRRLATLLSGPGDEQVGDSHTRDEAAVPQSPTERFLVRSGNRMHVVPASSIDWAEAESDHVRLHVGEKTYLLRTTLSSLEEQLDQKRFVRIHRSTIVNIQRVAALEPYSNREYVVILEDGTQLKLTRSYRDRLDAFFGSRF